MEILLKITQFWMIGLTIVIVGTLAAENLDPVVIQIKSTDPESQLSEKIFKGSRNISIIGDDFVLDGKPLYIMSGSLHYFRLPSEYWRDRLRKLKAAGLNSVATYVEWSSHEPEEDLTLFQGDQDIARFVRIAAEEGLYVLLRPGPYICAERDLGGLPYWLLSKYPNIKLRTTDKDFIEETRKWMSKLFNILKPLLYGNGGPIILVQVENEYGSYGASKPYMIQIRDIIKEHVRDNALLYTTDGSYRSYFYDGSVPDTLTTIDFGPVTSVNSTCKDLRTFMPVGPLMNSEYYPGWLTHWSENIQQVSTERVIFTLQDLIDNKIHFNFYMFFGGTNFEYSAGVYYDYNLSTFSAGFCYHRSPGASANYGSAYQPDITSYDYDAPLSEAGDPTPKYIAIRNTLAKNNLVTEYIPEPKPSEKGAYGNIEMKYTLNLFSKDGRTTFGVNYKKVTGSKLPTFEELRQRGGIVLYETILKDNDGILQIVQPRDWILVYVDNELQGVINRMLKLFTLTIKSKPGSVLSLVVENQGRINYGNKIHDFKGILSPVVFKNKTLEGPWTVTGYKFDNILEKLKSICSLSKTNATKGISVFKGELILPSGEEPKDTFIDPTGWGKGYLFVNGRNIGRYWPAVGPQVTLYVPGVWLLPAPATNIIHLIELERNAEKTTLDFIDYPILNRTGSLLQYVIFP